MVWRRPETMSCEEVRERIYPLLLRTVTAEDRLETLDHISGCDACRLALEAVRARLDGVVEVPATEPRRRPVARSGRRRLILFSLCLVPTVLAFALLIQQAIKTAEYRLEQRFLIRLQNALVQYSQDFGRFPPDTGTPLSVYLGTTEHGGPYLDLRRERLDGAGHFVDRWGNRWVYRCPGVRNRRLFDVQSYGHNRRDDGGQRDDIANWASRGKPRSD